MASWRLTALAVLLAGFQSAMCLDEVEDKCNVTKAITCYWAEAEVHGVQVLLPHGSQPYPSGVCRTPADFPEQSVCVHYYGACQEPEKQLFHEKETGYAQLRFLLLNKTMCEGVNKLSTCIHNETMAKCAAKFVKEFSLHNAKQNELAAKNLSHCLETALMPCSEVVVGEFIQYLENVASAVQHLYKHKEQPAPPTEPATTESSTTTVSPTKQSTTPEPVTETTTEPVTAATTEPVTATTSEPVPTTTSVPPTTQGPPGAASTAQAVGAFGVVAIAWLVRAA
ncbi:uncharacterized protein [Dermacentor andersoni]|uniref:uncharacterized protein n=1 Tax=Dermacentor andersoni TaxID=34620 RepID=UPI002155626D|nr:uncharacterized protein LOC126528366 [Dermacentor andersoni]